MDESIQAQMSEFELLRSMYTDDELQLICAAVDNDDEQENNVNCTSSSIDSDKFDGIEFLLHLVGVEFIVKLSIILQRCNDIQLELTFHLPIGYPSTEHPNIFVRTRCGCSIDLVRLNAQLRHHIATLAFDNPIVIDIINWVQENCDQYRQQITSTVAIQQAPSTSIGGYARYWIHSHHLYCSVKRRNLLALADQLEICGLSIAGKPGAIIVEGRYEHVHAYWDIIRTWKWKRLTLREAERFDSIDRLRMEKFAEMRTFGSIQHRCHNDLGEFRRYLATRGVEYGFALLFAL